MAVWIDSNTYTQSSARTLLPKPLGGAPGILVSWPRMYSVWTRPTASMDVPGPSIVYLGDNEAPRGAFGWRCGLTVPIRGARTLLPKSLDAVPGILVLQLAGPS